MKLAAILLIVVLFACQANELPATEFNVQVLETKILDSVSSASGITKVNDHYYMVGDDTPFLFQMDSVLNVLSKTAIFSTDSLINGNIIKAFKPDFETIEAISSKELITFGSGSYSPYRNLCVRIKLGDTITTQTYNLTAFYTQLKQHELLQGYELNIEGTAYVNGQLLLFNRGRNIIFTFNYTDLITYFEEGLSFPSVEAYLYQLPFLDGVEAGFSGATYIKEHNKLFFTASYETAPDAYGDGEILGSLIGIISFNNNQPSTEYQTIALPVDGVPLKIESIALDEIVSSNEINAVLVSDSDGGDSHFLHVKISY